MDRKRLEMVLYPVLAGLVLIFLLQTQVIHRIFGLKVLQLPLPLDVLRVFSQHLPDMGRNAVVTLQPALTGIILGSLIGYAVAMLVTLFPRGGYGALFLMVLINSIPIVAMAPLMNRWFAGGAAAKLVVVTIAATGGMAVNAFYGLNHLPEHSQEMMRISAATRRQVLFRLRIPASLPSVFTGLKIVLPSAMLAAIISEFFASETAGLGYMIKHSLKVGNQKQMGWAYILAMSLLSILLYIIVIMIERRVLRWHVSQRGR